MWRWAFLWMCKSGFVRINSAFPPRLGVPGPGPEQQDPVHGEPAGAARWLTGAPLRRAQPLWLGPDQTHVRVSVLLSLASETIFISSHGCKCLEFWHGQGPSSLHHGHPPLFYVYVLSLRSHVLLCNPMDCSPPGSSVHGDSPGKKTGVGCHVPLPGIFIEPASSAPALQEDSLPLSLWGYPCLISCLHYLSLGGVCVCVCTCMLTHPCPLLDSCEILAVT